MIESKAGFFKRIGKRFRYRKATKTIEQAERDLMIALEAYYPLKKEWRIKRFVAYNFEGFHVSKNPPKKLMGPDWQRERYPSGNTE